MKLRGERVLNIGRLRGILALILAFSPGRGKALRYALDRERVFRVSSPKAGAAEVEGTERTQGIGTRRERRCQVKVSAVPSVLIMCRARDSGQES